MSYQKNIHHHSNFKVLEDKGTFGTPLTNRARAAKIKKNTQPPTLAKKVFSVTGTAPAPSKDFFELAVYKDEVIFRKWRVRFNKNGKGVVPSEDKMDYESFLDSDVIQGEVERNLGSDALHMAVGHMTNIWLPRLPIKVITNITSHLTLSDIGRLQQVCSVFKQRLQKNEVWGKLLSRDFDIDVTKNLAIKNGKKSHRSVYKQQLERKKESEIDWDNI